MDQGRRFEHDQAVLLLCLAEATREAVARRRLKRGRVPDRQPKAGIYSQELAQTIGVARALREQARIQRERARQLRGAP